MNPAFSWCESRGFCSFKPFLIDFFSDPAGTSRLAKMEGKITMSQGMLKQGVPQTWMTRVTTYGRMIKFSHTVFALPFALVAAILVWRQVPVNIKDTAWIVLTMVSARSAAMGFNRVIDAPFDGKNPRTNMREIPSGRISAKAVWLFTGLSALLFIFATAMLGRQCLALAIPVLAILFFYSLIFPRPIKNSRCMDYSILRSISKGLFHNRIIYGQDVAIVTYFFKCCSLFSCFLSRLRHI